MPTLKFSLIRTMMIDNDLIVSVLSLNPLGALVTTISKSNEVQTRILLYFANEDAFWKNL